MLLALGLMVDSGSVSLSALADTATTTPPDPAQEQIDATQAQIDLLKKQIAELQTQLTATSQQKQTLQNAIKVLDLQIQKLQKSITLTNAQIAQKDKEIGGLSGNISDTSQKIGSSETQVAQSLRQLDQSDAESLVTLLLGTGTLSSFFDEAVTLSSLRSALENRIEDLGALKSNLQTSKSTAEGKRRELGGLKANLAQQKQGLSAARADQNTLLTQTKNKESAYQTLIAQKKAQEAQFEEDLLNYEQQLGLKVAPGSLPAARPGVLQWPVDSVRITQYFGNTAFATQNPQLYNGRGHTGVDFAASPGTPIKAARGGIVLGTGNTDLTCPNASYGKWVFIKHDNGLSTLYAHLSIISVSKGQPVAVGQVVGYSGSTGYATGPHLHFGVYASSGSEISSFASKSCRGRIYTMPVGDISAYLNPLSYLPTR